MKHFVSITDFSPKELGELLELAADIKAQPEAYRAAAGQKVLLMIFEKPSLRTRVSFETGMAHMGGHAIYYNTATSPLGAGKETVHDTIKTVSRYVDLVMARLFDHAHLVEMAEHSSVPVINGLTNYSHPCQIVADLLTMRERFGALAGRTLCYQGDSNNNVTHSLMLGGVMSGMNIRIGCPADAAFAPDPEVLVRARKIGAETGASCEVFHDAREAADGSDVVYTDSWMSYHIPKEEQASRHAILQPYQVNDAVMDAAGGDAVFMNCLPANRGFEQTASVIDGPQSVVFDQAENRMHGQNAVMVTLLRAVGEKR